MFALPGETYWTAAEVALNQIWFLLQAVVTDSRETDKATIGRTLLLEEFKQVEELLKTCNPAEFKIQSLHIVTPFYINGTGDWKMEQLSCVWSAQNLEEKWRDLFVFETKSGNRYCDSPMRKSMQELKISGMRLKLP
jgi:hypothetical protein